MQNKSFAVTLLATLSFLCGSMVGCGGNSSSTADATSATGSDSRSQTSGTSSRSDANQDRTAAPKQTVALFLDSLRRGDETTANSMLTTKARAELEKTAWVMQPLGTPDGKYNIGRIEFPYPDQALALVECRWIEPATATEPELIMDVVCETYQEAEGWRIAGIAVTVADEPEPLVIDFEDGTRLQQMLDMANGTMPATESDQVAQPAPSVDLRAADGFPTFPELPSGNAQEVATPPGMRNVLR
jgi:hypothetical protein